MAAPLGAMFGCLLMLSAAACLLERGEGSAQLAARGNPAELKLALVFGALYALVIVAVGSRALRVRIVVLFGLALAGGAAILLFWS